MDKNTARQLMMREIMYLATEVILPWTEKNHPENLCYDVDCGYKPRFRRILRLHTPDIYLSLLRRIEGRDDNSVVYGGLRYSYALNVQMLQDGYDSLDFELFIAPCKHYQPPQQYHCDARSTLKKKLYPTKYGVLQPQSKRICCPFSDLRRVHEIIIDIAQSYGSTLISKIDFSAVH